MQQKQLSRTLAIIAAAFILIIAIINFSDFARLIGSIVNVLCPLIVGLCIAFVLNIPLRILERIWDKLDSNSAKRSHSIAKRIICLLTCFVGIFGIFTALVFTVTPYIKTSVSTLMDSLPEFVEEIEALWLRFSDYLAEYSIKLPEIDFDTDKIIASVRDYFYDEPKSWVDTSINIVSTVASTLFDTVLAIVISIYVLAKKERLRTQAKRILRAFLSEKHFEVSLRVASLSASTFTRFLTGQLAEAAILGILCLIGMLIFGFPFAALISLIVGITALIPIFGAFIGIAIGAFLILLYSPLQALWFLIFITVLQQIEGNIIYPRVVGKSVGLPALWVLIAVTVGSSFGIMGMLVSVPLVSIIYCLVGQLVSAKLEEKMEPRPDTPKE